MLPQITGSVGQSVSARSKMRIFIMRLLVWLPAECRFLSRQSPTVGLGRGEGESLAPSGASEIPLFGYMLPVQALTSLGQLRNKEGLIPRG